MRIKVNLLILNILAMHSILAHAVPNVVEFEIAKNGLPQDSETVVAFIYETSEEGYNPGVAIYRNKYSHESKLFPIETESKFMSITHAEVEFNGHLHQKFQIDSSCNNFKVLQGDGSGSGAQFEYMIVDLRNRILSCTLNPLG